jgi:hypothetical protein
MMRGGGRRIMLRIGGRWCEKRERESIAVERGN